MTGKTGILYRGSRSGGGAHGRNGAAGDLPGGRRATLRELAKEAHAERAVFNNKVRTVLRGSYSHHYRRLLPDLLAALEFRCNNTTDGR